MYNVDGLPSRRASSGLRAFDAVRFRALFGYVIERDAPDPRCGAKVASLMWLCDFGAYLELGDALTGAIYVGDPTLGVTVSFEHAALALGADVQTAAERASGDSN